jgi:FkbM family methyltransferase
LEHFESRATLLVDVGANIGLYTMYWLTLNEMNSSLACEPFLPNIKMLKSNLELNKFQSRCNVVESPLSEVKQRVLPVITDERVGASGFTIDISPQLSPLGLVETSTLDETLSQVDELCILKIDTDGTDFEILKGASRALNQKKIVSVLIESSELQQVEIGKFLSQYGLHPDERFDQIENHSDIRRIAGGKTERNRIYTVN